MGRVRIPIGRWVAPPDDGARPAQDRIVGRARRPLPRRRPDRDDTDRDGNVAGGENRDGFATGTAPSAARTATDSAGFGSPAAAVWWWCGGGRWRQPDAFGWLAPRAPGEEVDEGLWVGGERGGVVIRGCHLYPAFRHVTSSHREGNAPAGSVEGLKARAATVAAELEDGTR